MSIFPLPSQSTRISDDRLKNILRDILAMKSTRDVSNAHGCSTTTVVAIRHGKYDPERVERIYRELQNESK